MVKKNCPLQTHEYENLMLKLMSKFLQHANASINIDTVIVPIHITYQEALNSFCNQLNINHLPELSSSNNRTRRLIESGYNRGGRRRVVQGHGRGRGCFRQG